jgi:2-polyprenyl-6-methoxyphenol hydroxylase-like FAD-dependent oxidoreductase
MKILIVGAGIGGLTLAAFLKESGIDYQIIEKSKDWNHQGYSLSIWNNGRNILKKLSLADVFDESGSRIKNYFLYDGAGRLLRKYNLSSFYSTYGMALTLISRLDLHNWLMSKIDPSKILMGTSIISIDQTEAAATVQFSNNETHHFDLVVGADGIHSQVRKLIFDDNIISSKIWRVWFMWVDNKYRTDSSINEYIAPGEFISIFDSGEKTLAIIAGLSNGTIWDDVQGRVERLKKNFAGETAIVPQIFDTLKDEDINPADLAHVKLNTWYKNRVVLLGDAAHGFEPHAGIGGSMALEDGYILAGELMQVSAEYPLGLALQNYQLRRKKRVATAYRLTYKMRAWALIRSKSLRKILNMIAPYFPEKYFVEDYMALLKEEI